MPPGGVLALPANIQEQPRLGGTLSRTVHVFVCRRSLEVARRAPVTPPPPWRTTRPAA